MIKHLACIMDGNRRWARLRNKPAWYGHQQGAEKIQTILEFCKKNKIAYVTLYAFSLENFKRSSVEKSALFSILKQYAQHKAQELKEHNIKIRMLGDLSLLPADVQKACEFVEQQTAHCTGLQCNFLLAYGAQQELQYAAQHMAQDQTRKEKQLQDYVWTAGIPEPDLIIRTGNVQRLSNFLLYQAAYAEIRFLPVLWPDITQQHLQQVLASYQEAVRNFGT